MGLWFRVSYFKLFQFMALRTFEAGFLRHRQRKHVCVCVHEVSRHHLDIIQNHENKLSHFRNDSILFWLGMALEDIL